MAPTEVVETLIPKDGSWGEGGEGVGGKMKLFKILSHLKTKSLVFSLHRKQLILATQNCISSLIKHASYIKSYNTQVKKRI